MAKKYKKTVLSPMEQSNGLLKTASSMKTYRIGMAGLDTSHAKAFAQILHDASLEHHVPGARIVVAFPGGSPDFTQSMSRVEGFTADLRDKHGVEMVEKLGDLKGKCDAVMLETIDGRVHLEQFREVADWGVPVFIDKPLTLSTDEAREIVKIAKEKNVRVTSASAMRFAESFQKVLPSAEGDPILGADFYGPMAELDKCPGYFWYGIHSAEMLFAAMGAGCREVQTVREESHDVITGRWADGRLGVLRGNRVGNNSFGGTLHRKSGSVSFSVSTGTKPFYVSLLEKVVPFLQGEGEVVSTDEMVEVIAFLEAANKSITTKSWVSL